MTPQEYFDDHGINARSIEQFGITFTDNKIIIPIRDAEGSFLYNKYRHLDPLNGKFSYDKGSSAVVFNSQILKRNQDYVFIVEGEPDCIRMNQLGISAVTSTSGAATFKKEWVEQFDGKRIYILLDNDDAGFKGTERLLTLFPKAIIVSLPLEFKDVCEYFKAHTLSDFQEIVDQIKKDRQASFEELSIVFDKWLLLPDKNVLKVFMACLVSHFLDADPLWMFFVAPPSGTKTEILSTSTDLPFVHMLSDLTTHTFASGMVGKKDASLLDRLKNNVILMKDFTTVISMRSDDKTVILSQLREIYDGRYVKEFGTGQRVDWEGRITMIAGVTTIIDTQSALFQVMGERFVMYRIPQASYEELAYMGINKSGNEKKMRKELKAITTKFFNSIDIPADSDIFIPEDMKRSLAALATFIVHARSSVLRNSYSHDIEYLPATEVPIRLVKQLVSLLKSLTILTHKTEADWKDYYLVVKVALDIIPRQRMNHIMALVEHDKATMLTSEITKKTKYSKSGSILILEDLVATKIVELLPTAGEYNWYLSDVSNNLLRRAIPFLPPNPRDLFPLDSEYFPLIEYISKLHAQSES